MGAQYPFLNYLWNIFKDNPIGNIKNLINSLWKHDGYLGKINYDLPIYFCIIYLAILFLIISWSFFDENDREFHFSLKGLKSFLIRFIVFTLFVLFFCTFLIIIISYETKDDDDDDNDDDDNDDDNDD
jgi:hypothetical protein